MTRFHIIDENGHIWADSIQSAERAKLKLSDIIAKIGEDEAKNIGLELVTEKPQQETNEQISIQCPYEANGYDNRQHYLECMAEDYEIDLFVVEQIADLLGPDEDFDGLVNALQDYEQVEFNNQ